MKRTKKKVAGVTSHASAVTSAEYRFIHWRKEGGKGRKRFNVQPRGELLPRERWIKVGERRIFPFLLVASRCFLVCLLASLRAL